MKSKQQEDEKEQSGKYIVFNFKCKKCGYEGQYMIQEKILERYKKNKSIHFKDNTIVSELCWQCDWEAKGYMK